VAAVSFNVPGRALLKFSALFCVDGYGATELSCYVIMRAAERATYVGP